MKIDIQDYIISFYNEKKTLMKITGYNEKNKTYKAILEDERIKDDIKTIEINNEDIIACLGRDPVNGSVYGCNVEIYLIKREVEDWGTGNIYFYTRLDKENRKYLLKNLKKVGKSIKEMGIDLHPFDTEIKDPKGKYEGMYKYRPRKVDGESIDLVTLKPHSFEDLSRLLYHEVGHGIWYRRLDEKIRAKWILSYHKAIELQHIDQQTIDELVEDFVKSGLSCKEFKKTLESPFDEVFKQCLHYVEEKQMLKISHLDTLIASGHDLTEYFNVDDVKIRNIRLVLTEYAQKSPEEFFAEAFSMQMTGTVLPKSLRILVDKSISRAKNFVEPESELESEN